MIGKNSSQEISLYFHIPFCTRKCSYCHFYVLPDKENSKIELLTAFKQEWEQWLPFLQNKTISTVYFGGGTPFLFGPERIASVLEFIKKDVTFASNRTEITLEANPENITLPIMKEYRDAGINRVSIGIQTLDDNLLKILGRLHQAKTASDAVIQTAEAGISNISVDLMYDLPMQTIEHWDHTLKQVRELPITHLSLYNLTIEPHTVFFKKQEILKKQLPDEETSLAMYERAIELLEEQGLKQYEISAFAKTGFHSRHNVGYWTARPFLGFGPSAFSYWEGKRFRNIANLKKYCYDLNNGLSPIDFEEKLDPQAHLRELLVIELRLREGVNLEEFQIRHGTIDTQTLDLLKALKQQNYVNIDDFIVKLSKRGILFYDSVASELI